MPPQNKPQNAKNHISQKKILGDLGIYPASPSYSLTLTFIEATIFTVFNFNSGTRLNVPRISEQTELEFKKRVGPGRGHLTYLGR